jgi:hypothetical protein
MAKKQSLVNRLKSKRYIIAAVFSAVAALEMSNPGTLAGLLGENVTAKLVAIAAAFNIFTKELDEKKAKKAAGE